MSSSRTDTATVDVTMPQMGVSVAEGTIVEWKKEPGDWVEADETICEISTDKIDTEVPSPATGRVSEVLVAVGETVEVGVVLARIVTDDAPGTAHVLERTENGERRTEDERTEDGEQRTEERPRPGPRRYSPVVLRIAEQHGVDLDSIEGTGRGGRVRKQDVLAVVENGHGAAATEPPLHIESPYRPDPAPASAPVVAGPYTPPAAEPLSRMRKSIGEHMKRSLDTAATCTTWIEVDFSRIEAARAQSRLTALPYVARATIAALRELPSLNAWLDGDKVTRHEEVNLGIAVSLGEDGLIVPVIHGAQDLSVEGLSKRIKDIARRARDKALTPDDVQGGTFTITNPGQYGSVMATPVINQPQVAILDVEAVVKRPVVVTDEQGNDSIAIRPICVLGLSWDHRALDGVLSARFLASVKTHVEAGTGN